MIGALLVTCLPLGKLAAAAEDESPPLLRWDLLRDTHYLPRTGVTWPDALVQFEEKTVRLEGYLMRKFGSQDPQDLLVTALHPSSLICGPTDMTAFVEVYFPGFQTDTWPDLPVEVVGTFFLSKNPTNLKFIYHLFGVSWKPLRRWEQEFPGTPDELLQPRDLGEP